MSWLRIIHGTTYRYRAPVRFGPHRLVLRPREGHDVRVEEMRLEITPHCELEWSRDLFGNSIATAHFLHPRKNCASAARWCWSRPPFPLRPERPSPLVPFPVDFSDFESAVATAYQATTFPDDVAQVRHGCARNRSRHVDGAEDASLSWPAQSAEDITYRRREQKAYKPRPTLARSSGSCRDIATLMLEALRVLGMPARFASGYLDCAASEAGRASTHAWAEAYLPEIGWIGYDPTLGKATSGKHVVTGVSNHPRGVMPISGTFFDEQNFYLGMKVTVQTERMSEGTFVGKPLDCVPAGRVDDEG